MLRKPLQLVAGLALMNAMCDESRNPKGDREACVSGSLLL